MRRHKSTRANFDVKRTFSNPTSEQFSATNRAGYKTLRAEFINFSWILLSILLSFSSFRFLVKATKKWVFSALEKKSASACKHELHTELSLSSLYNAREWNKFSQLNCYRKSELQIVLSFSVTSCIRYMNLLKKLKYIDPLLFIDINI